MSLKTVASQVLRSAGLFEFADGCRGGFDRIKSHRSRRKFQRENPGFVLPPADLAYDAYGRWNAETYRRQGREHAQYIAGLINQYRPEARVIVEWGCGPMRVLRHMPAIFRNHSIIGLDYNPKTIEWCKRQFRSIQFHHNDLSPPLPLKDGQADVIYSISVLTHLSEPLHYSYVVDLVRCLSPGGILIVTLQGDSFVHKLMANERAKYERGQLVVRDGVTEGKRGFSAFHNPMFVRDLFKNLEILVHDTARRVPGFSQDTWVVKRSG
jgi:SAM-dependent methyltransferase